MLAKLCIELIILNLTIIIDIIIIIISTLPLLDWLLYSWVLYKIYKKKFNASNSTKSQLHQPPQDNSCSAHKQPKIIDEYIKTANSIVLLLSLGVLCLYTAFAVRLPLAFFKK
jgi:hypothetical protein